MSEIAHINSSHIASSSYDPAENTLTITFRDGRSYAYHGMSSIEHQAFMQAPSAGQHFRRHIRGKYPHTKL